MISNTVPTPAHMLRLALSHPRHAGRGPGYFYAVDVLRGLAALSILFWHYSHFFMRGALELPHRTADYPLFRPFRILYEHGGNAVQLFWLISGFTFSAVYTARPMSTRAFATHRFARLYPLHLVTLLTVVGLQIASVRVLGHSSIYPNNDWPHFVDQIFLTSGWGPTIRFSFDGPVWTVSVELIMYGLFWLLLPYLFCAGLVIPLALAVLLLFLSRLGPFAHILQGGFFFFSGCALYPLYLACRDRSAARVAAAGLPVAAAILLLVLRGAVGPGSTLLCAGLLLLAAFSEVERFWPGGKHAMRWLGDNTYGTYLWHIPVQIVVLIGVERFEIGTALFASPVFLLAYLAIVVAIARASFLWFEHPWRARINARFTPSRPSASDVAARTDGLTAS